MLFRSALVVGLPVALFGLMALVGAATGNGWVRLIAGAIVVVALPLVVADKLLPHDDLGSARGLTTDVLAVAWLALALVFIVLGGGAARGPLLREADRNWKAGWTAVARAEMRIASARPVLKKLHGAGAADRDHGGRADRDGAHARKQAPPPNQGAPRDVDGGTSRAPDAGAADGGTRPERTPAELFREFAPAGVTVQTTSAGPFGEREGGGTGFVIDGQGTIVTNHHVIEDARKIKIKLFDGTVVDDVEILEESEQDDLALLRIPARASQKRVVLGDSDAVTVGERVISIGNPLGLEHTLTDGLVSARRRIQGRRLIQTSAPVSPGNSGGPLFNMRGEVIGVTVAQYGGPFASAQNLNLAVPINLLKPMIRDQYPGRHRAGEDGSNAGRW